MALGYAVAHFKVKPGREAELLEGVKNLKRVVQRLGAQVRASRARVGDPTRIVMVVEWPSIAAWGTGQADPELRTLTDGMRNNANPPWETIEIAMFEEIPL